MSRAVASILVVLFAVVSNAECQNEQVKYVHYSPALTTLSGEILYLDKVSTSNFKGSAFTGATSLFVLRTPYLVRVVSPTAPERDIPIGVSEIRLIFPRGLEQIRRFFIGTHVKMTGILKEELPRGGDYPILTMYVQTFRVINER